MEPTSMRSMLERHTNIAATSLIFDDPEIAMAVRCIRKPGTASNEYDHGEFGEEWRRGYEACLLSVARGLTDPWIQISRGADNVLVIKLPRSQWAKLLSTPHIFDERTVRLTLAAPD